MTMCLPLSDGWPCASEGVLWALWQPGIRRIMDGAMHTHLHNLTHTTIIERNKRLILHDTQHWSHWACGKGIHCLVGDVSKVESGKGGLAFLSTCLQYMKDCKVLSEEWRKCDIMYLLCFQPMHGPICTWRRLIGKVNCLSQPEVPLRKTFF